MNRARALLEVRLEIVALAVLATLAARTQPVVALLLAVLAAAFAGVLLKAWPRWLAWVAVGAGGAVAAMIALAIHEDLRGERRDEGPDPTADRMELPASTSAAGEPLHVLVWGDCREGVTVLDDICDAIRTRRPAFSIGLGDLVGMAREYQFEILRDRLRETDVPFHVVPGNHDVDPFGTLRPYCRVFQARNWTFADPAHRALFVGLDTARGVLDPKDVDWVERLVRGRGPETKHVLLCCHHPLYEPAGHAEKPLPEDDATKRLRALVEEAGVHVFASHFHGYDVQSHGGATQVTTGGAGARPESDAPYHYVWVTIDDAGVRAEKVDVAQQSEVSEFRDRMLVFRDEGRYATGAFPVRVSVGFLALAFFLGGLAAGVVPGRRPSSRPS